MYLNSASSKSSTRMRASFVVDERDGFRPAGLAAFARPQGAQPLDDDPVPRQGSYNQRLRAVHDGFRESRDEMVSAEPRADGAPRFASAGFPHFADHDYAWFFKKPSAFTSRTSRQPLLARPVPPPPCDSWARTSRPARHRTRTRPHHPPPSPLSTQPAQHVRRRDAHGPSQVRSAGRLRADPGEVQPPAARSPGRSPSGPPISDRAIAAARAYTEYVWQRYGRFPVHVPPFAAASPAKWSTWMPRVLRPLLSPRSARLAQRADFHATTGRGCPPGPVRPARSRRAPAS